METNERWHKFLETHMGGRPGQHGYIRQWWISDHGNLKWTYPHNDKVVIKRLSETGGHAKSGRYQALTINHAPEKYIHRLVALYFVENPEGKPTVNHKDGNKLNNHYTNLEWMTKREQMLHAYTVLGQLPFGGRPGRKKKNTNI